MKRGERNKRRIKKKRELEFCRLCVVFYICDADATATAAAARV